MRNDSPDFGSNAHRIIAYGYAMTALSLSGFAYHEYRFVGFPDGFLSEWDRLRQLLLLVFVGFGLAAGVGSFVLARMSTKKRIGRQLWRTGVLFAVLVMMAWLSNQYLCQMSGRGG